MSIDRRQFLSLAAGALVAPILESPLSKLTLTPEAPPKIRAVAFDAFPIFDPRSAFKVVQEQFPEQGEAFRKLWFSKVFSYTWLRTVGGTYRNFPAVMVDALKFSAASLKLELTPLKRDTILDAFVHLPVWPDVKPALEQLRNQNIRLAFLSNMTEDMLRANMKHNGIEDYFEHVLSTDRVKAYKPDPKAYQLGTEAFGQIRQVIAFAAFAGWDAAGASWFGYPTVWINRLNSPVEELSVQPTVIGNNLQALTDFVIR